MKYIFKALLFILLITYCIIEILYKTIINILNFLWDFRIKKRYLTYERIYFIDVNIKDFRYITYKQFFLNEIK